MNQKPLISIVIATFNGLHHLKKCLPSLDKLRGSSYEIVLVDNNSTDDTVSYIFRNFPKVKLIKAKRNYGYAKGNDIGYQASSGEYIVFLSNDTYVKHDFLDQIVDIFTANPEIGGIQSKIRLMDEPEVLDSVGTFFTDTGFLYHYGILKKDTKKYSQMIDIFSAKGACMSFRRTALEAIKVEGELFDSRYFAYFEETDLCHRVWLSGLRIVYAPKSVIFHKMGGTSSGFNSAFIQFHSFKNRMNSYCKNLEIGTLVFVLPVHMVFCFFLATMYLIQGNRGMFQAILKAMWWNILNIQDTLKKRTYIQTHIRKWSDSEIFLRVRRNPRLAYYYYLFLYQGLRYFKD